MCAAVSELFQAKWLSLSPWEGTAVSTVGLSINSAWCWGSSHFLAQIQKDKNIHSCFSSICFWRGQGGVVFCITLEGVFLVLWGWAGEDESIWGKQVLPVVCWGVWYNFCSTWACGLQSPAADTEDTLLPPYMNSHLYMKILDCVLVLFLQYLYPPAMLCLCKMVNLPLLWWCYSHFTSSKPLKLFSS